MDIKYNISLLYSVQNLSLLNDLELGMSKVSWYGVYNEALMKCLKAIYFYKY